MNRKFQSLLRVISFGLLLPLAGCALVGDLLNPSLAQSIGLDTAGSVIVVVQNATNGMAVFSLVEVASYNAAATPPAVGARNFTISTDPGETRNEVLDCPLDLVTLGVMGGDFAIDPATAVTVVTVTEEATETIDVPYAGSPLFNDTDFNCGDVIEITLVAQTGAADETGYGISIRILPGN